MKMYYLEFIHSSENGNYTMQSKWFKTKSETLEAYHDFFDYISREMKVFIMVANCNQEGDYEDIDICCEITK